MLVLVLRIGPSRGRSDSCGRHGQPRSSSMRIKRGYFCSSAQIHPVILTTLIRLKPRLTMHQRSGVMQHPRRSRFQRHLLLLLMMMMMVVLRILPEPTKPTKRMIAIEFIIRESLKSVEVPIEIRFDPTMIGCVFGDRNGGRHIKRHVHVHIHPHGRHRSGWPHISG